MKITNNGSAWLGSFNLSVVFIARDVLHDGPVEVEVTTHENVVTRGMLQQVDESGDLILDGVTVEVDNLASFELVN